MHLLQRDWRRDEGLISVGTPPALSSAMHTELAARLAAADLEYSTAQAKHDGSSSACERYRAALEELKAAERAASQALRGLMECPRPSAGQR